MKNFKVKNTNPLNDQSNTAICRSNFLCAVGRVFGLAVLGLLFLTAANFNARGQSVDNFNPSVNSVIRDAIIQPDGKILIVGGFSTVGGQTRIGIARLNADGMLDAAFNPSIGGNNVASAALQADGKILIGGDFSTVSGQPRNRLARLNPDGTLDAAFNANVLPLQSQTGAITVLTIVVQPDGKILIGGTGFTQVGGQPRSNIARLNADGTVDAAFNPNANGAVRVIRLQPDGKILVGGFFTSIGGAAASQMARLNQDGTRDASFNTTVLGEVYAIAVQPDGKILFGRDTSYGGPLKAFSRLNANGTLDTAFNDNVDYGSGAVNAITLLPDGRILVGGISSNPVKPFRFNADGTKDPTFNVYHFGVISDIEVLPDGKYLVSGVFSYINGADRNHIARLLPNSRRAKFDFDADGRADISVFRPASGEWYINQSTSGFRGAQLGTGADKLAPADYDGDYRTDLAVWRESASASFYVFQSATNTFRTEQFGTTGDVPTPADYDGDGRADFAVYRNGAAAGAQSVFYYRPSAAPGTDFRAINWGAGGDVPAVGDYDGDGRTDAAVFRPANGIWYVSRTSNNQLQAAQFGVASDRLVPDDYDGDGKTDYAVFRNGIWYLLNSTTGFAGIQFGLNTDMPTPADYDGDGKADVAIFRSGTWYLNRSTNGFDGLMFGAATDKPIPNAYVR